MLPMRSDIPASAQGRSQCRQQETPQAATPEKPTPNRDLHRAPSRHGLSRADKCPLLYRGTVCGCKSCGIPNHTAQSNPANRQKTLGANCPTRASPSISGRPAFRLLRVLHAHTLAMNHWTRAKAKTIFLGNHDALLIEAPLDCLDAVEPRSGGHGWSQQIILDRVRPWLGRKSWLFTPTAMKMRRARQCGT